MADFETRIRILEDVEAIKNLKAKYWRCVDQKLYEEMAQCFAEDGVMEIVDRQVRRQGNQVIAEGVRETLGRTDITTVHHGYCIRIVVEGDVAVGQWAFQDIIVGREKNTTFKGWGYYDDEYRREAYGWVMSKSRISRQYTESTTTTQAWPPSRSVDF